MEKIEVKISSKTRRTLYDEAFRTLSNSRKIIIWVCLAIMFVISLSLIRFNTNCFSVRLEDNPNKIIGFIALLFVAVAAVLMLIMPFLAMSRLRRNLPDNTAIYVSEREIQVNQIKVDKKDISEILKLGDFLFAVVTSNGKFRYLIVPFFAEFRQNLLSKLNAYEYPKIRNINSFRKFPWIRGHK